jgi:hypothetical protein
MERASFYAIKAPSKMPVNERKYAAFLLLNAEKWLCFAFFHKQLDERGQEQ